MSHYHEQRRYSRRLCKQSATIWTDDAKIGCVIVDESELGAGLVLVDDVPLPRSFKLVMRSGEARQVELVWHSPPRCGVVFRTS